MLSTLKALELLTIDQHRVCIGSIIIQRENDNYVKCSSKYYDHREIYTQQDMSAFVTKLNEREGKKLEGGHIERKLTQRERKKRHKGRESKISKRKSETVNSMSEGRLKAIEKT